MKHSGTCSSKETLSTALPLLGAHNLSKAAFSLDSMMLLNNGLKYVPVPQLLTKTQLLSAIARFKRSIRLRCMFGSTGPMNLFKLPNPCFVPKPAPASIEQYLTEVESTLIERFESVLMQHRPEHNLNRAAAQALQALRSQTEFVIKPADKNLGLTIMCAQDYQAAVAAHVADTSTYKDVTDNVSEVIRTTCRKLESLVERYYCILGKHVSKYLLDGLQMRSPPHLYIMPKLHKMRTLHSPIVGRPIAACHSWVTTNMSKWLADTLNAALTKYDTVLIDRNQLLRELEGMRIKKDAWLVTFDVESLYPHVEHDGCSTACASAVPGSSEMKTMIEEFVRFVLKHNVVTVQNRYYQQIFGGAMGTNCMPPAAQLYLAIMWEGVIKQRLGSAFPKIFRRFIDDGFVIFDGSESELLAFLDVLNTTLPNIKITFSYSQFQVDFLDLVIYKCTEDALGVPNGTVRLKVRTHQKVLNKYLYIPFTSFHHPGMFKSFIHAELIRYVVTNSDQHWFDCMVRKFTHRLLQRGYPKHMITSIISHVSHAERQRYLSRSSCIATSSGKCALVVPYAQMVPQIQPQKLLHTAYVNGGEALHAALPSRPIVAFSKNRNLGSMLVKASH